MFRSQDVEVAEEFHHVGPLSVTLHHDDIITVQLLLAKDPAGSRGAQRETTAFDVLDAGRDTDWACCIHVFQLFLPFENTLLKGDSRNCSRDSVACFSPILPL